MLKLPESVGRQQLNLCVVSTGQAAEALPDNGVYVTNEADTPATVAELLVSLQ